MRSALPPLDLHAHVDPVAPEEDLRNLGAVIFAATRSLAEASTALRRSDAQVVWGVGAHPGVASAHQNFDPDKFRSLVERTAFVGELGLDGDTRVPLDLQLQTLREALKILAGASRITSLHSYRATDQLVGALHARPVPGVVLHWWLGGVTATERAIKLGCYFSINAAMFRHPSVLRHIPLDRLLTETDHPYGDRPGPGPHRPGNVLPVEYAIARLHRLEPADVRRKMWRNLNRLASETDGSHLLSQRIRSYLIASGELP